jgi:hypothetical protein
MRWECGLGGREEKYMQKFRGNILVLYFKMFLVSRLNVMNLMEVVVS